MELRARAAAAPVHLRARQRRPVHQRPRLGPARRRDAAAPADRRSAGAGRARQPVHGPGAGGDGAAPSVGADRVELYTEAYAARATARRSRQRCWRDFARSARGGAGRSAWASTPGHDLNRDNLADFLRAVPGVLEVSIGHALIADALELGYRRDGAPTTCAASGARTARRDDLRHRHRHLRRAPHRARRWSATASASPSGCWAAANWPSGARAARAGPSAACATWPRASRPRKRSARRSAWACACPMTWRACEIVNAAQRQAGASCCTACLPNGSTRAGWVAHVSRHRRNRLRGGFVVVESENANE